MSENAVPTSRTRFVRSFGEASQNPGNLNDSLGHPRADMLKRLLAQGKPLNHRFLREHAARNGVSTDELSVGTPVAPLSSTRVGGNECAATCRGEAEAHVSCARPGS